MSQPLDLAIIVPTFNERNNVPLLVEKLDAVLVGLSWEAIFVDDNSPDGTADAARALGVTDRRVRVIQRFGRRGLSSATIEGMCATAAPLVAVIDGDLQHDETILPAMVQALRADPELDVVIGSRFVDGGGTGDWDKDRVAKSAFATKLSRRVIHADLSDPMSGFFMLRTATLREMVPHLAAIGFKILLDIMTTATTPLKFKEIGYTFRVRTEGESKLDHVVAMEFLIALYDRMFGNIVPVRFVMFATIGLLGALVHLAVLAPLPHETRDSFRIASIIATIVAMTFNFFLNNALTYRDQRLRGAKALFEGWVAFCLVCAVGAIADVGLAVFLFNPHTGAWILAALAGTAVGAVWNYALSSRFVWGRY